MISIRLWTLRISIWLIVSVHAALPRFSPTVRDGSQQRQFTMRLRGGVDYSKFDALVCSDTPPSSSLDEDDVFQDPAKHDASCRAFHPGLDDSIPILEKDAHSNPIHRPTSQTEQETADEEQRDSDPSPAVVMNTLLSRDEQSKQSVTVGELVDAKLAGEDTSAVEAMNRINLTVTPLRASTKRRAHIYKGRKVYEWEQSFEEVNIYLTIPPRIKCDDLHVNIETRRVVVGVKGRRAYLNSTLFHPVRSVPESTWMLEGNALQIYLVKAQPGLTWERAFEGHDRISAEDEKKVDSDIHLEKCREDYPNFFINHDSELPSGRAAELERTQNDIDKLLAEHGALPSEADAVRQYLAQQSAQ